MTDCPNVEIRELLPAYMHGTLPVAHRSRVKGHLAECGDCAAELAALEAVRAAFAGVPAVDTAAIVAALPRPTPVRRAAPRSWRGSQALQIAAAVSFIALGGISLAVARSFFTGEAPSAQVDSVGLVDSTPATGVAGTPVISFAGGVGDLQDEELEWLLSAIESLEALPSAEPDELPLSGVGRQGS